MTSLLKVHQSPIYKYHNLYYMNTMNSILQVQQSLIYEYNNLQSISTINYTPTQYPRYAKDSN